MQRQRGLEGDRDGVSVCVCVCIVFNDYSIYGYESICVLFIGGVLRGVGVLPQASHLNYHKNRLFLRPSSCRHLHVKQTSTPAELSPVGQRRELSPVGQRRRSQVSLAKRPCLPVQVPTVDCPEGGAGEP